MWLDLVPRSHKTSKDLKASKNSKTAAQKQADLEEEKENAIYSIDSVLKRSLVHKSSRIRD